MKGYVIDASVTVKWFVPEIYTEQAALLLKGEVPLNAPDLLIPEFGNILWKKCQRKELSPAQAEEALRVFRKIPVTFYPSYDLIAHSLKIAIRLEETVYDCLYLTLAESLSCQLVTADHVLFEKAKKHKKAANICWIEDLGS